MSLVFPCFQCDGLVSFLPLVHVSLVFPCLQCTGIVSFLSLVHVTLECCLVPVSRQFVLWCFGAFAYSRGALWLMVDPFSFHLKTGPGDSNLKSGML